MAYTRNNNMNYILPSNHKAYRVTMNPETIISTVNIFNLQKKKSEIDMIFYMVPEAVKDIRIKLTNSPLSTTNFSKAPTIRFIWADMLSHVSTGTTKC